MLPDFDAYSKQTVHTWAKHRGPPPQMPTASGFAGSMEIRCVRVSPALARGTVPVPLIERQCTRRNATQSITAQCVRRGTLSVLL